jgi:hypothetical protein
MKLLSAFLGCLFIGLVLTGCGDSFRYPCQNPDNFDKPSCNPPVCEATGTCTKYLIGEPDAK